jgi:hypothetical protein
MMDQLQPQDTIDRTAEKEIFAKLLGECPQARLLTICDAGARGKSSLLRLLEYNCRRQMTPAVSASIVVLDQLDDPTALGFVTRVVGGLPVASRDRFENFVRLSHALAIRDASAFDGGASLRWLEQLKAFGKVEVGRQEGGTAAALYAQQANIHVAAPVPFTEDLLQLARQSCVEAFFDDLRTICATDPLVLFLDAWEKCDTGLRIWLRDEFIATHCLDEDLERRSTLLAVVVAGRPHHPRTERHGLRPDDFRDLVRTDAEFEEAVRSIRELSKWTKDHVREFFLLNGCDAPKDDDIDMLQRKLREGWNLFHALQFVELVASVA